MARDLGDFQTPPALVSAVLAYLAATGRAWRRVVEPTCGRGNFIAGLLDMAQPPAEIHGIELQDMHVEVARSLLVQASSTRVVIRKASLFDLDLRRDLEWSETGPLLVVGNPPWVTNSELGVLRSSNLPRKRNLKGLRGIDALTGESNFDIAEYIWIKLIKELAAERPTIALLCKTSVARNVLQHAFNAMLPVTHASIRRIDARRWFGAAVDACLFHVEVGSRGPRHQVHVYPDLQASSPETTIALVGGRLVSDLAAYQHSAFADGSCPVTWRQGIKHDAASVMELITDDYGQLRNRSGEIVAAETEYIYPLVKGSDLFRSDDIRLQRWVVVTQTQIGQDTRGLQVVAPRLWIYLTAHSPEFERRQSSIYRGQPAFAMFGIGEYSFAPYKVGVSGLHKTPRFRAIGPSGGRPVMLDDTCYFTACWSAEQAAFLTALLNDPLCLEFIRTMVFGGSKRPITKRLLQRIDLKAVVARVDRASLLRRADDELERLATLPHTQGATWPSSLDLFLVDHPPKADLAVQRALF